MKRLFYLLTVVLSMAATVRADVKIVALPQTVALYPEPSFVTVTVAYPGEPDEQHHSQVLRAAIEPIVKSLAYMTTQPQHGTVRAQIVKPAIACGGGVCGPIGSLKPTALRVVQRREEGGFKAIFAAEPQTRDIDHCLAVARLMCARADQKLEVVGSGLEREIRLTE